MQGCVAGWRLAVVVGSVRPYIDLLLPFLMPSYMTLAEPKVFNCFLSVGNCIINLCYTRTTFLLTSLRRHVIYSIVYRPQVWMTGLGQALLMLGPGTALFLNHASHLSFRFPLRRCVASKDVELIITVSLFSRKNV